MMLSITYLLLHYVPYLAEEFFVSGTADSYAATGPLTSDGRWDVVVAGQAPFRTRLIVYRPADPTAFNGTAVVEWLNVSAGMDAAAAWLTTHRHLLRAGFAWVGVSAQRIGIEGIETAEEAGVEVRAVAGDGGASGSNAGGGGASGSNAGEGGAGEQRGTGWWPIVPSLKSADPTRYAILSHPGDAYSFDIFRQAGETVRRGLLDRRG
ncbi:MULTISPECIES: alpha/beta hydrolase domain-containing protein [unclassified Frankia]